MKFLNASTKFLNWIKANPVLFGVVTGLVVLFLIVVIGLAAVGSAKRRK